MFTRADGCSHAVRIQHIDKLLAGGSLVAFGTGGLVGSPATESAV